MAHTCNPCTLESRQDDYKWVWGLPGLQMKLYLKTNQQTKDNLNSWYHSSVSQMDYSNNITRQNWIVFMGSLYYLL